jgi:Protein of unknown function (DUF4232)
MTSPAIAARAVLAAAAITCGGGLLAACSSNGSAAAPGNVTQTVTATPSAPATATGPASSAQASSPACATSALSVTMGQGNGAAGSEFIPIVFTNTSGSPCSLFGYPGVSFVTGVNGSQVGAAAHRDSTTPAQLVNLAAGGVAHATLQVVDAENFPLKACKLTSVHTLKVFPPGQTAALYVSLPAQTCASKSADTQVLNIQTIAPGNGG